MCGKIRTLLTAPRCALTAVGHTLLTAGGPTWIKQNLKKIKIKAVVSLCCSTPLPQIPPRALKRRLPAYGIQTVTVTASALRGWERPRVGKYLLLLRLIRTQGGVPPQCSPRERAKGHTFLLSHRAPRCWLLSPSHGRRPLCPPARGHSLWKHGERSGWVQRRPPQIRASPNLGPRECDLSWK